MKHSVLKRQMQKLGINESSLDEKTKELLITVDNFYNKQDESRNRLNHVIATLTKENDELIDNLKNRAAKAIQDSKMAVLGEMSGGIAHEINNPLMILEASISLVNDMVEGNSEVATCIQEQMKTAEYTVDRIAKIVKGLRTFARDGSLDPFSSSNLKDIFSDTLTLCSENLKKNKVIIKNNITQDIILDCRTSQLSQVFLNLILNSKDAISKQRERWIQVDTVETDQFVTIRIIDSGKGIPEAVQEKMMNPFFTTKEIGKGAGLGLSVSKGIIESHNGTLKVNNEMKNTCLEIHLPKKQIKAA